VAGDPRLRQWTAPAVEAAHPLKRQIGRPSEELRRLGLVDAQPPHHRLPYGFLTGHRQGRIDPIQGHPVDQPLPLRPVPPGQRVAEATVVEEVAMSGPTRPPHLRTHLRQGIGEPESVIGAGRAIPGDVAAAMVLQIPVEARGHRDAAVAADDDLAVARLDLEDVAAVPGRDHLKSEMLGVVRKEAGQQAAGRFDGRRLRGRLTAAGRRRDTSQDQSCRYNGSTSHGLLPPGEASARDPSSLGSGGTPWIRDHAIGEPTGRQRSRISFC